MQCFQRGSEEGGADLPPARSVFPQGKEQRSAGGNGVVPLLRDIPVQIEQAAHWWELPAPEERAATYLRLLTAQMGVGGDDSWGSPVHDEFHVDASGTQVLDVTLSLI